METVSQYLDAGDPASIVDRSDYRPFIVRYIEVFGEKNVLVLPLELLSQNPQTYANRMLDFLEVPRCTLDEKDLAIVLKAAEPRSKMVARIVKMLAFWLRRMGFLQVLGRLKRIELIRKALYRPSSAPASVEFGSESKRIEQMDAGYPELLAQYGIDLLL